MTRKVVVGLGIAVALAILVWFAWPKPPSKTPTKTVAAGSAKVETPSVAFDPRTPPIAATGIAAPADSQAGSFFPFGAEPSSLGRGTSPEGKPVAPSSFLADADGVLVLDQEKQRLVRADGTSIPLPGKHADDVARGADGSLAVLDRKDAKDVAILDANGHVRGRLPLEGTGIDDPRDVSRVVVSGNDVYVERNGGGPLLRLGGMDGKPAENRTEIQGIPTRDGAGLISAGITNEDEGRAWLNMADRNAVHRWTRELKFPAELSAVAFLDSDPNGSIWVVLLAGSTPADYVNWAVCVDPKDGKAKKSITLGVENPPWESFRDFAIRPGGTLVAATRSEKGVTFASYDCP